MKKNKSGISLIILAITIVILIIIAGAGITVTNNMINNSKKVSFAEDLKKIQDLVKEYYVSNGVLPIGQNISFTKQEFLNGQSQTYRSALEAEMSFNYDDSEDNVFYKVDLAKIGIESSTRGTDTTSGGTDIYVMSKDTMTVYYYQGYIIDDLIFYSLTDKLADIEKIEQSETDNSTISITDVSDIKAVKNTELISNSITVTITGTLGEGESLKYKLYESGTYTTIPSLPATITIDSSSFANNTIIHNFNIDKKMTIEKVGTSQIIYVDLSNLDISGPTITGYTVNRSAEKFNILDISATDVKYFYYEYVTKIDETGAEVSYYETQPDITVEYLKSVGKKTNEVILDKSIQSIKVIAVDDAGNATSIYLVENIAMD